MKIEIRDYVKKIKSATVLLGINLTLESGKIYGFRGPNGCGKTMLMRAICGLIRPTAGKVLLDGEELFKDISFPRSVGVLLENPSFLPGYTGKENLMMLASIQKKIGEKDVCDALHRVGLDPLDSRRYYKYSLGMKQRLGIAAAIMEKPDLILLDEPLNALDESGMEQIKTAIFRERDRGALILLACHDKEEMNLLADVIFTMAEGTITGREEKEADK